MIFCPNCNAQISANSVKCPECGYLLQQQSQQNMSKQQTTQHTEDLALKIGGWLCVAASTLFVPILFGAAGVICGYLLSRHEKEHGVVMMIAAVACAIFGALLGAAIMGQYAN